MKILDVLELLLLAAVWGASFLFMRIASPVLGPVWLIELRVLLAGLILLLFVIKLGLITEIRRKLVPLLMVGCINSAIPFVLFAYASLSLPAGFTSILNATTPLFGTMLSFIWLKEKLTISRIVGFVLGFAGVVVLVGWKTVSVTQSFNLAVTAGLSAAFLYAIAAPYTKKYLSDVSPFVIAAGSQLSAALIILFFTPFTIPSSVPTLQIIFAVIALSLFCTALAYILYFRLIQNIGVTKSLTVTYLIPIFAMLWGMLFLKEPITTSMIIGCFFILSGVAIANNLFSNLFN
ncbi:MAG: DMT family transporter [Richelia sp. RM2_1_2]|nr:DMT family transporter [Richelia sp. SM1_7_0]NJN07660.1 DMT family transporter [Richelia sp. RM1_1_1]NJO29485.1 DMT family transporter [Richelia sp. SL_2_1]NJO60999.1 DMT family transporter [Richelia sp. RM2_1_2]